MNEQTPEILCKGVKKTSGNLKFCNTEHFLSSRTFLDNHAGGGLAGPSSPSPGNPVHILNQPQPYRKTRMLDKTRGSPSGKQTFAIESGWLALLHRAGLIFTLALFPEGEAQTWHTLMACAGKTPGEICPRKSPAQAELFHSLQFFRSPYK